MSVARVTGGHRRIGLEGRRLGVRITARGRSRPRGQGRTRLARGAAEPHGRPPPR